MRVPARVFADRELIEQIAADRSLEQLQNVATLPGIFGSALAMPDKGYGFPVGGVAATEPPDGVVPPAAWATTSTAACGCSRSRSRSKSSAIALKLWRTRSRDGCRSTPGMGAR